MIDWRQHIISDKNILVGKPVIKGTRLSVEHIIHLLATGWNVQQILDNYPNLSDKDISAVFAYIKDCLHDGLLYELTKTA